jgi:hypothetical protein
VLSLVGITVTSYGIHDLIQHTLALREKIQLTVVGIPLMVVKIELVMVVSKLLEANAGSGSTDSVGRGLQFAFESGTVNVQIMHRAPIGICSSH